MGELNQQQKDTIKKLSLLEGQNPESSMQLHSCHRELGGEDVKTVFQSSDTDSVVLCKDSYYWT